MVREYPMGWMILACGLLALGGVGCASLTGGSTDAVSPQTEIAADDLDEEMAPTDLAPVKPFGDSESEQVRRYLGRGGDRDRLAATTRPADIEKLLPREVKEQVGYHLDYFTRRGRKHYERWLSRSTRYLPMMKRTFAEQELPIDLVYLAMIESGCNPFAVSHANAVGMWQFIASTGRRYGLEISSYVDERRDPQKATLAAARYLKDLYQQFGSWDLALASYNAGEAKIERGVRRHSTDNFWEIRKTAFLRPETRDYVPRYLAALMIARNPEKYGFEHVVYQRPLHFEVVMVPGGLSLRSLARVCDATQDELRSLNPELRRSITPPGSRYALRVPPGRGEKVQAKIAALAKESRQASRFASSGYHRVRGGQTLSGIARRYGVSTRALARANRMKTTDVLRAGRKLQIPGQTRAARASGSGTVYVVKRGDTLAKISARFDTTVRALMRYNQLRHSRIQVGKQLLIPAGEV
jgi:membrane-bound lytic murein transglycosylase D